MVVKGKDHQPEPVVEALQLGIEGQQGPAQDPRNVDETTELILLHWKDTAHILKTKTNEREDLGDSRNLIINFQKMFVVMIYDACVNLI